MNPVCWIREDGVIAFNEQKEVDSQGYKWNPLYMLRELSDEEIDYTTKKYFDIHPEAKLSEQFKIKLYELEDFARAILKKARGK
jgi:hypothetical protein